MTSFFFCRARGCAGAGRSETGSNESSSNRSTAFRGGTSVFAIATAPALAVPSPCMAWGQDCDDDPTPPPSPLPLPPHGTSECMHNSCRLAAFDAGFVVWLGSLEASSARVARSGTNSDINFVDCGVRWPRSRAGGCAGVLEHRSCGFDRSCLGFGIAGSCLSFY